MLKFQLDSLDGVDEAVRALYTEKDGKFVLGIEGLPQQEDVSGLKAKVDELLGEKKLAEKKAREAEEAARLEREEAARKPATTARENGHSSALTSERENWRKLLTKPEPVD
mgnify:CR=1 FL=1